VTTHRLYNGAVRILPLTKYRSARALAATLLLIVALAACQQATPIPTVETPLARPTGGELVMMGSDPPTLDPHQSADATSASIVVEIFGGLVTLNRGLQVASDLAARWELSPDGTTYTFYLRSDARFHNGKGVTADDFKWSLERATDPATASPGATSYLNDIVGISDKLSGKATELAGVKVLDEHTLSITIDAPKSYFLSKLTYPVAFVLDGQTVGDDPNWTHQPNGTGPFKLKEYVPKQRLVLERNSIYHLGAPHLDRVRLMLAGGNPTFMYENDEIHVTGVGSSTLERVMDPENPLHSQLITAAGEFSVGYIGMNVNQPPLDDVRVRQALNYAVDRKRIAHAFLNDLVIPANGVLPPGFPGHNPDLKGYDYDPEKGRSLLLASQYGKSGEPFPRIVLTISGRFGSPLGIEVGPILAMWRDNLGIDVEVQRTESDTFLQDMRSQRLQMSQIGWVADYLDPENFLDNLFHSDSNNNHTGYSNPELDSLLERARVERNEEARFALYRRAEEMILEDAPWVSLWHPGQSYVLVKPYVHDYQPTPIVVPILRYVYMTR